MNNGKKLEALIKKACEEQGVDYTRLKDAGWTGEQTTRRFTVKNICDTILFFNRTLVFCEIKHRLKSLRFDEITQLEDLKKKWKPFNYIFSGVLAKLDGQMFFLDVPSLMIIQSELGKKSFNSNDAAKFGLIVTLTKPNRARVDRPNMASLILEIADE